jgi:hypothetical protein
MTEELEEDYAAYREAMEAAHFHHALADCGRYVNDYGIDKLLKRLVTYVDNPAQAMLTQRCIEWIDGDYNRQLRNKKAADWIRLNEEINDAEL